MNRTHYRTKRPLWEDVAGWVLAVTIGVLLAAYLVIGLSK